MNNIKADANCECMTIECERIYDIQNNNGKLILVLILISICL